MFKRAIYAKAVKLKLQFKVLCLRANVVATQLTDGARCSQVLIYALTGQVKITVRVFLWRL